jgi:DNA-binding transcriptional MerR regulator
MSPAEPAKSRPNDEGGPSGGRAPSERRGKSAGAFRTISEVAEELAVPQHVLRFWETKFLQVKPLKRGGGRRYYRPEDVALLSEIRSLLYEDGYTIRGVQKLFREGGVRPREDGEGEPDAASPAVAVSSPAPVEPAASPEQIAADHQLEDVIDELAALRDRLARFLDD